MIHTKSKFANASKNISKNGYLGKIALIGIFILSGLIPFALYDTSKNTIVLSDSGFNPAKIKVLEGTTVTWKIEGKNPRWPASDFHPAHEIYPELDPLRALKPGESWSFTFEKAGIWHAHDHTEPEITGVIEVIGKDDTPNKNFQSAPRLLKVAERFLSNNSESKKPMLSGKELLRDCLEQKSPETCFKEKFTVLSREQDFASVLKTFREVVRLSKNPIGCHQIAHAVSRVYVEKEPENWQKFLANAPEDCNYGFIHGSIEAKGRLSGTDLQITPGLIREICLGILNSTNGESGQCVHVMGHMLLVGDKGDVRKSLGSCLRLDDELYPDQCFHGAFMENLTKINLAAEGLANINVKSNIRDRFSQEEVSALCDESSPYPEDLCWKEMSHVYTFISNFDPNFSFDSCEKNAPSNSAAESCITHALLSIIAQNQNDPLHTRPVCDIQTAVIPDFQKECSLLVARHAADSEYHNKQKSVSFCSEVPAYIRESCFSTVGKAFVESSLAVDERKVVCFNADPEFRELCEGS